MGTTIGSMNKGVTKFQNALKKVSASQEAYSRSMVTVLKQSLTQQKRMASALGVMAKEARLRTRIMQQLLNANKAAVKGPKQQWQGPPMAQWMQMQKNFQGMVKNLYSMLPKQIQGYLKQLQSALRSHLSSAWSKISSSNQAFSINFVGVKTLKKAGKPLINLLNTM